MKKHVVKAPSELRSFLYQGIRRLAVEEMEKIKAKRTIKKNKYLINNLPTSSSRCPELVEGWRGVGVRPKK